MKQTVILGKEEIAEEEILEYRCPDGKRVLGLAHFPLSKEYLVFIEGIKDLCYVSEKNAWRLKKGLVIENEL